MSSALQAGAHADPMRDYLRDGERRALSLGNRGPLRFTAGGALAPDILDAYWRFGFYVFEGVLGGEELADIERDVHEILDRLPVGKDAEVDRHGRPAIGVGLQAPSLFWSKPLGDPFGGSSLAGGRHPVKMREFDAGPDAPDEVVYLMLGSLQYSEALLRLYGHPQLLAAAASVNGEDFAPFNEALFLKAPGLGASVAWHRDGLTHYDSPDFDPGSHGFNFMAQLYGSTPANGVWVVPGTHRERRVDIPAMVEAAGSELLPDAVPIVCAPGDVAMTNRQAVHGSFANTSPHWRVTCNFGFHRRRSVLGVRGGGLHNEPAVYDAERIRQRSRILGYAIDARRRRFPDETPYRYRPFEASGDEWRWDDEAKALMRDYNLLDLSI